MSDTSRRPHASRRRTVALMVWVMAGCYGLLLRRSARRILLGRLLDPDRPASGRWLVQDVDRFLASTRRHTRRLLPLAELDRLPTWGNRHNVYLAVLTTGAYRALRARGISRTYAITLLGDVGWNIYRWLLSAAALPFRILLRDRSKRMRSTLRALMIFPFSAPGPPGYAVEVWTEGADLHTHWSHCPPLAFVRRVIAADGDRGELEAFRESWCRYDWAAADLLIGDGSHGHYQRRQTLSHGDPVCDMCWRACSRAAPERPGSRAGHARETHRHKRS